MAKKILIVDDDCDLCEELAEILCDNGYQAEFVCDDKKFQKKVDEFEADLLILDFKMPGLNGAEILRMTKEKRPGTKFIMISGKHNIEEIVREERIEDSVSGVMQKPIDIEELLKKISSVLQQA